MDPIIQSTEAEECAIVCLSSDNACTPPTDATVIFFRQCDSGSFPAMQQSLFAGNATVALSGNAMGVVFRQHDEGLCVPATRWGVVFQQHDRGCVTAFLPWQRTDISSPYLRIFHILMLVSLEFVYVCASSFTGKSDRGGSGEICW